MKVIRINKVKQLKDYRPLMSTDTKEKIWQGIHRGMIARNVLIKQELGKEKSPP